MGNDNQNSSVGLTAFLVGGIIGSAATFLFTPFSGEELRNNIKNEIDSYIRNAKKRGEALVKDAKAASDDLVIKAEQLLALTQKYADGTYTGSIDKVEKEIKSIKAAFDAAFHQYKKDIRETVPTEQIVEDIFSNYEDELLPKQEGMRRRTIK